MIDREQQRCAGELGAGEAMELYDSPAGLQIREMLRFTAIGGPERVREDNRERAEYALRERSGGLPTVVVLEPADADRAIQVAVEIARAQQAEQQAS